MVVLSDNQLRVLAIDPSSRGFGFVVLEGPDKLVDWGVKSARQNKNKQCLAKIGELIEFYRPDLLAVENCVGKSSRRCERIQRLLSAIVELTAQRKTRLR